MTVPAGSSTGRSKRVPTAPVAITSTAKEIVPANTDRRGLLLQNVGSKTIYLGRDNTISSTVYTSRMAANDKIEDTSSLDSWWGVCAAGDSSTMAYEEVSQV